MKVSRPTLAIGVTLALLAALGWLSSDRVRAILNTPKLDGERGKKAEEQLATQLAMQDTVRASFEFLENSAGGAWQHYCVLDYTSTDGAVESYAKQHSLYSGKIWLKSFYDDEQMWSVVLLSESKYLQIPMASGCITVQDIIAQCAPLKSAQLHVSKFGAGDKCVQGRFALSRSVQ